MMRSPKINYDIDLVQTKKSGGYLSKDLGRKEKENVRYSKSNLKC